METVELRPMSLGELLDHTFSLYRKNFWVFVGIMAIPASFGIPMNYLVLASQGDTLSAGRSPSVPSPGLILGFVAGYFVFVALMMFVYSIAVAAATFAVSESYLGRKSTVRGSYGKIRGKFWRLIGVVVNIFIRCLGILIGVMSVAVGLAIGIAAAIGVLAAGSGGRALMAAGVFLLVFLAYIGGIALVVYFALRYAVSIPALLLENLGVFASIRRSVQLTRGRRGHIFLALLLATIIGYVGVIVFQGPLLAVTMITVIRNGHVPAWLALLSSVFGAVGGAITGPISMIVLVLCYYDTRIRKEAFDLQFMMASLDSPSPAAGTVSPA